MNTKTISASIILLLGVALSAHAEEAKSVAASDTLAQKISSVTTTDSHIKRDGSSVVVDMTIDLSELKPRSTRAVLLTPYIISGADSLALPSIGIYGRQRYYYYVRKDNGMISGKDETTLWDKNRTDTIAYHANATYCDWMNDCELVLVRRDYSCCEKTVGSESENLIDHALYVPPVPETPSVRYVSPKAEVVKSREVNGRANVIFPVGKTTINPNLGNNTIELNKIRASIDSIRLDKDITVTSINLKGYASPEGSYESNKRLASGRTDAIRDYILKFADIKRKLMHTEAEPEDWEGFITWLKESDIPEKYKMLEIAENKSLTPDQKEQKLKKAAPKAYASIVKEVFPSLRRTEYRIDYSIRSFSDPKEMLEIMKTQPQKLSMQEFFLAASSLQMGSEEFNEVFETAARIYPDDPVANLNAASAAIEREEYKRAARHLEKAGEDGEAAWARGVLAACTENYEEAAKQFHIAAELGIEGAQEAAEAFDKYIEEVNKSNN